VTIFGLGATSGPTAVTGDARGGVLPEFFNYQAERNYADLQWSPDGERLAFQDSGSLYVLTSDEAPVQIAGGVMGILSAAWSPDGSEIAYAVDARQTAPDNPSASVIQLQAVPAEGGSPRVAGTITHIVGCGGGGRGPSGQLYERETGYEGNRQAVFWTSHGFVHMNGCNGVGLVLSDPSGDRLWEQAELARPVLSPDRSRIAAVRIGAGPDGAPTPTGIVLVDVESGESTPLNVSGIPDQIAWSADGQSLYYSTRTQSDTIPLQPNAPLPDFFRPETLLYTVELWSVPVSGGESTQLWTGDGFAIGRISASSTAAVVAFSLIQHEGVLYRAAVPGADPAALIAAAPQIQIGLVSLAPDTPGYPFFLQGGASSPAFSGAAQFTAVPAVQMAPTLPSGDNPLGLQIGGKALVTSDINVNVRIEPRIAPGNVLTLLRPGDTVTILNGPVSADDLRWWQVRRDSDSSSGWVADQVIDAQGAVTDNLTPIQ
jgi:dipeptidyl aminopeptidase/acylaminoacyl peptidase